MTSNQLEKYLSSRAITSPWCISGRAGTGFAGAVIIPALAEGANLFATLRSLAENPFEHLSRFLVLVVVNHREDAPHEDKADNLGTLALLPEWARGFSRLRLAWVDAASPGLELPAKGGGVGMARKLGHDLVLPLLDRGADPLLVSLDADTVVEPTYLPAIVRHFAENGAGGAVISFRHRDGSTPEEQAAIVRYELFLRAYVLGLALAGSPYAFHTVGSAMACRASAYVRMGGMNTRVAGEDFYFLQHLKKTAGIAGVGGATVFPSPRRSHRVPFGTGRSVGTMLDAGRGALLFYRTECYTLLAEWLRLAEGGRGMSGAEVLARAGEISGELAGYLENEGVVETWERLQRNHRDEERFKAAFHGWFDGLRTMKLVHHLSACPFPRCGPEEALPPLFALAGLDPEGDLICWLDLLRRIQGAGADL